MFLERAGKLSDDILAGPALVDAPKGGAPGGDTATGVLIDFTFAGDKNFSPKYATATVDLTQTGHAGQQVVTHKAFTGFLFGDDGVEHKAVYPRERHLRADDHRRPRRQDREGDPDRLLVHGGPGVEVTPVRRACPQAAGDGATLALTPPSAPARRPSRRGPACGRAPSAPP